jgi:hypothetical protein
VNSYLELSRSILNRYWQTMPGHKFRVGQIVNYNPSRRLDAPRGVYTITARLPQSDDGQFEYRIKHSSEPHERIAKENELTGA